MNPINNSFAASTAGQPQSQQYHVRPLGAEYNDWLRGQSRFERESDARWQVPANEEAGEQGRLLGRQRLRSAHLPHLPNPTYENLPMLMMFTQWQTGKLAISLRQLLPMLPNRLIFEQKLNELVQLHRLLRQQQLYSGSYNRVWRPSTFPSPRGSEGCSSNETSSDSPQSGSTPPEEIDADLALIDNASNCSPAMPNETTGNQKPT